MQRWKVLCCEYLSPKSGFSGSLKFIPKLVQRHVENAMHAGAKLVFEIKFKFWEPEEAFDRQHQLTIPVLGTKVTPRTA